MLEVSHFLGFLSVELLSFLFSLLLSKFFGLSLSLFRVLGFLECLVLIIDCFLLELFGVSFIGLLLGLLGLSFRFLLEELLLFLL